MVAELVEYRLSRYLTGKEAAGEDAWILRVSHADGRPILFLNRVRNAGLPEGTATFVAEGREYVGRFMKVALNVAELPGHAGNALHALLRGWFGPSAGHPGTSHQVVLQKVGDGFAMRPVEATGEQSAEVIPLFSTYEVACGAFASKSWGEHAASAVSVQRTSGTGPLNPARQFVCFARGDSMDGGSDPVRHGDPLLFEWVEGGSARDYVEKRVLVEQSDRSGTSAALKLLRREGNVYRLESTNPAYPPIDGQRDMAVAAVLRRRLTQSEVNPLASRIGERFKRQDVPSVYGHEYNPGNWQAGHVSIAPHVVLFVTLTKSDAMTWGADYIDHFEGQDTFVWSSQTSTAPDGKKGREILDALENGTFIHLWVRRRKTEVAFAYLGLVAPVSHEGAKPMSVRFRLLTPVSEHLYRQLTRSAG